MSMIALLAVILVVGLFLFSAIHYSESKPRFRELLSKSSAINRLSLARLFLFGSRDVWFVIALPVYLQSQLHWSYLQVGSLMAIWIIGYGAIQAITPKITNRSRSKHHASTIDGNVLAKWGMLLAVIPVIMALALTFSQDQGLAVVLCLGPFAFVFATNSGIHSYLILAYAERDSVSLDVGFYYMANAGGRLLGTVMSGFIYQTFGLVSCLIASSVMIVVSCLSARNLPSPALN